MRGWHWMDGMVIIGHRSSKSTFCANNGKETLYYQSRQSLLTIDLHPSYCDTWVFQVGATSELGTYLVIVMLMMMMITMKLMTMTMIVTMMITMVLVLLMMMTIVKLESIVQTSDPSTGLSGLCAMCNGLAPTPPWGHWSSWSSSMPSWWSSTSSPLWSWSWGPRQSELPVCSGLLLTPTHHLNHQFINLVNYNYLYAHIFPWRRSAHSQVLSNLGRNWARGFLWCKSLIYYHCFPRKYHEHDHHDQDIFRLAWNLTCGFLLRNLTFMRAHGIWCPLYLPGLCVQTICKPNRCACNRFLAISFMVRIHHWRWAAW